MLCSTTLAIYYALALNVCLQKDSAQPADSVSGVMTSAKIEEPSVTIRTTRGEAVAPQNPERAAAYDFGVLDTLNKLSVPTGMSVDKNLLPYLDAYFKQIRLTGTLFEPDYEVLNAHKLQLVIIGSRTAKAFNQLNRITPIVEMTVDTAHLKDSAKKHADALAQIFGEQVEAGKLKAEINVSFGAAKAVVLGKGKGLVILVNGGRMSAFDIGSRLDGWFHQDIGVPAVDSSIKEEGNHDQPVTFEYIKKASPNWLFVLDHSAAIGEEGKVAKDVLDSPLVAETTVQEKEQVVYLPPEAYLAAGSIQGLLNASKQVIEAFNAAK